MENKLDAKLIEDFRQLDSSSVSDALDRLGLKGGLLGIKAVVPGSKLCGQAFTVHYTACGETRGTVGDFLDDVNPGEVVVIDNGGRLDCTVWGDIMSLHASKRGIAGTVIDGVCRDIPVIDQLRYPIFTKGTYMVTGKDRVYVDGVNTPVTISAVQVAAGDLLLADGSGAVVVPCRHAAAVLEAALDIEAKERSIREEILKGTTLRQARANLGYHALQSRR